MSKKIICFYPSIKKGTNHFLYNLSTLLENDNDIECWSYKEIKKSSPKKLFDANIYHFNWFDQSITFFSFLKRLYFLLFLKIKNKKIIWTIHNIEPHLKQPKYNFILRELLIRFSDKIHIMNSDSENIVYLRKVKFKTVWIPHGDYFNSYPESTIIIYQRYQISSKKKIILFLGAILPYKNVDVLIEAYQKAFRLIEECPVLLICGKTELDFYKEKIKTLINGNKNIIYDPKFIIDEEMAAYLRNATILVAPYSYKSALNSGTVPLAFSYGKTIICPDIPYVKDVLKESNCLYSYHYDNPFQHKEKLVEAFLEFYSDLKDSIRFWDKEKKATLYMERHSWKAHQKDWISLYKDL